MLSGRWCQKGNCPILNKHRLWDSTITSTLSYVDIYYLGQRFSNHELLVIYVVYRKGIGIYKELKKKLVLIYFIVTSELRNVFIKHHDRSWPQIVKVWLHRQNNPQSSLVTSEDKQSQVLGCTLGCALGPKCCNETARCRHIRSFAFNSGMK